MSLIIDVLSSAAEHSAEKQCKLTVDVDFIS